MDFIERILYSLAGIFLGLLIAMSIIFWTEFESAIFLFKVCMIAGGTGGFLFGGQFLTFLKSLIDTIW